MSGENVIRKYFKKPQKESKKPNLPRRLFWDVRYEEMDWQWSSRYMITRVPDRGNDLKKIPIYLMDHSIQRACT